MLSLVNYLENKESTVWEIPSIYEHDASITSWKYHTYYDDTQGTGSLKNSKEFSFSTNNEDIWLLPSSAYLLCTVTLSKNNDETYAANEGCTIDKNAFNIFQEARYYADDREIEKLDYLGISTMLYNLTKYTTTEVNSIRETQLISTDVTFLKKYVQECNNEIQLLLPIRKIFPFWHHTKHAIRGIKHRFVLTLNDMSKIVHRFANEKADPQITLVNEDGKIVIKQLELKIPYLEPSLPIVARLESMLTKNSVLPIHYSATSVYKFQPPQNTEIRVPLSCTIHRPTNIFVAFQNINRSTDQAHSYMHFDNLNVESVTADVNSMQYPDKEIRCDFNKPYKVVEIYQKFLEACEEGMSYEESLRNFINQFPVFHIDISKHPPELYDTSSFPTINIKAKFKAAPAQQYYMFVILYNIRDVTIDIQNKQMKILK